MSKQTATEYELLDDEGVTWAVASLTPARLKALLREYGKQEIYLTPKAVA